jgi:hypothetical protein
MGTWLVSFADAVFRQSQRRQCASAIVHGIANIRAFGPRDLAGDPFYEAHRDIFSRRRGAGYWLWKPLLIRRVLAEMPDGDTLLYLDASVEVIDSVKPLEVLVANNGGVVPFRLPGRKIGNWTKRDCLILLGCDSPDYYEQEQVCATYLALGKCPAAVELVDEWLAAGGDARAITDDPNVLGEDDLPLFVEHRHDQSILSLLVRKRRLPVYRNPAQPPEPESNPAPPHADSPYGQLFNHHGQRRFPISTIPGRVVSRVRRSLERTNRVRSMFPAAALRPFIDRNRKTLSSVPHWIEDSVYANSIFHYGLPEQARPFIDMPIAPDVTYSDALMYLSTFLTKPIHYLEMGVSVGKNFAQSLHALQNATLCALDIEEINPTLEKFLTSRSVTEIPDPIASIRKAPVRVSDYAFPSRSNTVRYIAGDGMHEISWQPLAGRKFNILFSDMLHEPEGLLFENEMIKKLDLIDGDEFVMAWDDLGGTMEVAFRRIAADLRRRYGQLLVTTVPVRGWLGRNEFHHNIGLVLKLPGYAASLSPKLAGALLRHDQGVPGNAPRE